jgi:8-oxo-dGTP pyrophosphatase MutT (NUDIX family)
MPGGGIEETDPNLEAALKREVNEELGADVDILKLVFELTRQTASNLSTKESFFLCALRRLDPAQRNGPEFSEPDRGEYIIDELLLDSRLLLSTNIKPDELKDFLAKHWTKLFTLPDLRA